MEVPTKLKDIIGNKKNIQMMVNWIQQIKKQHIKSKTEITEKDTTITKKRQIDCVKPCLFISGDPGIGKSTLLLQREFKKHSV